MVTDIGNLCTGCTACASVCSKKCLQMRPNEEGFLYPELEQGLCTHCGTCLKICPVAEYREKKNPFNFGKYKVAGLHPKKGAGDFSECASAGFFYALACETVRHGGYVYGAVLSGKVKDGIMHVCGVTEEDILPMRNSKYVQSDLRGIFPVIKKQLLEHPEKNVLFSGTPCQCAGLHSYLGKDFKNLFCMDFVCHGVPSPLAFGKYIGWLEKRLKRPVRDYQFRCKKRGWNYKGRMSSIVKADRYYWPVVFDPYMMSFLKAKNYRESCYSCKFRGSERYSDITVGDFGGVREEHPEFFSKDGCSVMLVNSPKGMELFHLVEHNFECIDLTVEEICRYNPCIVESCRRPKERDDVYAKINILSGKDYVKKILSRNIVWKDIVLWYLPGRLTNCIRTVKRRLRRIESSKV